MQFDTPIKRHSNSSNQGDRLALDTYADTARHMPGAANPNFTVGVSEYLHTVYPGNPEDLIRNLLDAACNPTGNGGSGHDDIVRVLNTISLCFVDMLAPKKKDKVRAIMFVSTPKNRIPEDDMNTDIRPDWHAYMTSYDVLEKSVRQNVKPEPGSYYSIIGIGEQVSGGSDSDGKIMHYLRILSTYRYDLRTVHAFQYNHKDHAGRHWSFNACGWAYSDWMKSDPEPKPDAEQREFLLPWVQHVLFLYSSNNSRIGHIARGNHVRVNIWTVEGKSYIVVLFYVSSGPGRMTAMFIVLSGIGANYVIGVFKRQWRDRAGRFIEGALLSEAQGTHWYGCFPDPASFGPWNNANETIRNIYQTIRDTYEITQYGYAVSRELSLLDTRTWGSPLTSCTTTTELLMTAYDAILAHWLLFKKCGILHRDISWNNVLCKPRHFLTAQELEERLERKQKFRKPIKEVLNGSPDEWCALLVDFDQAVKYEEQHGHGDERRLERTGTPMFIAVEKSTMRKVKVPERQVVDLLHLSTKLSEAENAHRAKFMLAFPSKEENEIFNRNWKAVLNSETDRQMNLRDLGRFELDPFNAHQAYHDVESFFWVFLWTFARAQPEGFNSAETDEYVSFCDIMLHHEIKTRGSDKRFEYLFSAQRYLPDIFHPQLERFSELFIDMAEYLSIPWGRHESLKLPDDHVHLAMLRLLLRAILREDTEKNEPIQIANKIRHFTSEFRSKEVRPNSQSKSASRSIPFSEALSLGTIPEMEDLQPLVSSLARTEITHHSIGQGVEKSNDDDVQAGGADPDASETVNLLPLPPNPGALLGEVGILVQGLTGGLPDKNPQNPLNATRTTRNSSRSSANNEDSPVDENPPPIGTRRRTRPTSNTREGKGPLQKNQKP